VGSGGLQMSKIARQSNNKHQQNSVVDARTQALAVQNTPKDHWIERAKALAKLVIREGTPFNVSALQAGYSEAIYARDYQA